MGPKHGLFYLIFLCGASVTIGILYPIESESREIKSLDGRWNFKAEQSNSDGDGFRERWYNDDFDLDNTSISMPVPSSFNDITQLARLRDHVGWVWYQRTFFVPKSWTSKRIVLRFGSVHYFAAVFLNGRNVVNHTGGHLPFESEVNDVVSATSLNRLTVAVNNTLSSSTIPPGEFVYRSGSVYPPGHFEQTPDFDFFNYAGIHRSVLLYLTPTLYIDDITVSTSLAGTSGYVSYSISVGGKRTEDFDTSVRLLDAGGHVVAESLETESSLTLCRPQLWWPRGMGKESVAYLYTMEITITTKTNDANDDQNDVYRLPVGIRSINVSSTQFLINNQPVYFKGIDTHEDSDINGRGFNLPIMMKDLNLLEWLNADAFRTSHYPYAEERLVEADRRGFLVIGEISAVGLRYFNKQTLQLHSDLLMEMIERDRNHPSIVMWSLANEPQTEQKASRSYFNYLIEITHKADPTRPVTIVHNTNALKDQTADLPVDVLCVNRYYGWYHELGYLELIQALVTEELENWHTKYKKPVIMSEYGAEAVAGMTTYPPVAFSEVYQVQVFSEYHKALDKLKEQFLIGEFVWNLADFATAQSITRVGSLNRKGLFTRNRQPKLAAYVLKERYYNLSRHTSGDDADDSDNEDCSWLKSSITANGFDYRFA